MGTAVLQHRARCQHAGTFSFNVHTCACDRGLYRRLTLYAIAWPPSASCPSGVGSVGNTAPLCKLVALQQGLLQAVSIIAGKPSRWSQHHPRSLWHRTQFAARAPVRTQGQARTNIRAGFQRSQQPASRSPAVLALAWHARRVLQIPSCEL